MESSTYGTAEVAARTGLSGALLRTWEDRYDFPRPTRVGTGRRRYSEADVLALLDVKRRRDAGVRLAAAIDEVRRASTSTSASLFVHVRQNWPSASVHRLSKKMVLALTHAIEDECHASAREAVLFGLFQSAENYAAAEERWQELAKSARAALVFADFAVDDGTALPRGPVAVSLDPASPLCAEWAVIVDGVDMPVALVAREALSAPRRGGSGQFFDTVWTFDPAAVRDVARECNRLATRSGVDSAGTVQVLLDQPVATPAEVGAPGSAATALFSRVLSYAGATE